MIPERKEQSLGDLPEFIDAFRWVFGRVIVSIDLSSDKNLFSISLSLYFDENYIDCLPNSLSSNIVRYLLSGG
jgi:hypothetical protein